MKIKIKNRDIKEEGQVVLSDDAIVEALFSSNLLENCAANDSVSVQNFNKWANAYDIEEIPVITNQVDHSKNQNTWKMPKKYKELDIISHLYSLCNTQTQLDRVNAELSLYTERNMLDVLRYLVYLVDIMRENNVLWGLGRGSSVASYILFLLKIHRVDSIKYNLDITEFLKD
jgi:DNA polymerase III alpha subunit